MHKAVKVRIYPDARQQALLRRQIGHSRAVYNFGLRWAIWQYHEALETGEKPKSPSHFTFTAWLTEFKKNEEVAWLNEVPVNVLSLSLERLARAYKNFFARRKQGFGFPRPKGKHSPRTARHGRTIKVTPCGRYVSIAPREMGYMRMRGWRPELEGKIKNITVEWAKSDRWYMALMLDDGLEGIGVEPKDSQRVLAVHCGLNDHVTIYDGCNAEHFPNDGLLAQAEANLKRKDRNLSRKAEAAKKSPRDEDGRQPYSKRREKARIQRARAHEKVANQRLDRANKLAHQIASRADIVVIEAWGIKAMMREPEFAKGIADAAWGQLNTRIEIKVKEMGGQVVKLEKYFPCSQLCSNCEQVHGTKVPLCKEWTCMHCGVKHNRNVNAAINVYRAGVSA